MSAVLLGLFEDHAVASRVRVDLVRDGFPTDRVDLTSANDLGRAGVQPASSPHDCFLKYFWTVLGPRDGSLHAQHLAHRLDEGAAAVTVQPRGRIETARAIEMLRSAGVSELVQHDLGNQRLERAAATEDKAPWIRNLWIEPSPETDCIYCRLFPGKTPRTSARH